MEQLGSHQGMNLQELGRSDQFYALTILTTVTSWNGGLQVYKGTHFIECLQTCRYSCKAQVASAHNTVVEYLLCRTLELAQK